MSVYVSIFRSVIFNLAKLHLNFLYTKLRCRFVLFLLINKDDKEVFGQTYIYPYRITGRYMVISVYLLCHLSVHTRPYNAPLYGKASNNACGKNITEIVFASHQDGRESLQSVPWQAFLTAEDNYFPHNGLIYNKKD